MSRGQRLVRKLANQQRCYSQLSRHISTLKRNRDNMGTYNSSTQSSPLKPSPALTFSSQCAKCFANGAHLAVSWHSSCRAGRIYARREQVTTRRVQHRTKRNTHLRAPPLPPQPAGAPRQAPPWRIPPSPRGRRRERSGRMKRTTRRDSWSKVRTVCKLSKSELAFRSPAAYGISQGAKCSRSDWSGEN